MKKIEILFPEICNLFGDSFNIKYLKECLRAEKFIETSLTDDPLFVKEDVDMIYMGSMSESAQRLVVEKLKPYIGRIKELIKKGTVFLVTGNALEVFGKYIEDINSKEKEECLGIFDTYAKRNLNKRYNTLFLGSFEKMKIMGSKTTFSFSYGDNSKNYAFKVIRGCGINKESKLEGIRENNFFGTYLIGPILIVNPDFTKYLFKLIGMKNPELKFEKEMKECYKIRLAEYENPGISFEQ